MSVLVVEDDDALRLAFCDALTDAGFAALPAATEEEALGHLRTESIDLIVLDLQLGNTRSIGLADEASYFAPGADVIVVTGTTLFPFGELHRAAPNIAWTLRKPVKLNDLVSLAKFSVVRKPRCTGFLRGDMNA